MIFSEILQSCFEVGELIWLGMLFEVAGKLSVNRTTNGQLPTKGY